MKLTGHISRHDNLLAHKLLFWDPKHGQRGRGRPQLTFLDMLQRDTGLESISEIETLMLDRHEWRCTIAARTLKPI